MKPKKRRVRTVIGLFAASPIFSSGKEAARCTKAVVTTDLLAAKIRQTSSPQPFESW
jgi:hypothetical protein